MLGNILEWYDFALYGYLLKPSQSSFFQATILLFSMLAVYGFLLQAILCVLWVRYCLVSWRSFWEKNALTASIFLMAVPVTAMGLIPNYGRWGLFASFLMIFCRLLQGIAVGGEFGGSMVYLLESSPTERRGFLSGIIMSSANIGLLLSSFVASVVVSWAAGTAYADDAWRLPFLFGSVLAVLGFYFRRHMPETPVFETHAKAVEPTKVFFSTLPMETVLGRSRHAFRHGRFLYIFMYLVTYWQTHLGYSLRFALQLNALDLGLLVIFMPLFGWVADRRGVRP